jgi:hypothetical protein
VLLCDRPHAKTIDFDNSRFVVGKICGLNVNGRHLERGDEIPRGALSASSLREIYEPPLSLIEILEFAVRDESLLQACLRRDSTCTDDNLDTEFIATGGPTKELAPACKVCGGPLNSCDCMPEDEMINTVISDETKRQRERSASKRRKR